MTAAVIPEDLVAAPPGAGLSAALAGIELPAVPNDAVLAVAVAQYRQLCHEQARMVAVLVELARCAGGVEPGQVVRRTAPDAFASDEIRAALRWTRNAADCEHELAERVVHELPGVHAAWLAGEIDRQRVLVFDRYLTGLTPAQIAEICRVAVPRAPKLTTGQLAVLLRRMVIAVDPEAAARWYRKGVRERDVSAYLAHDGTVVLSANGLPADEAEAACERLQELAVAARRAGHPGMIGQIRCDLYLGMLDGRFHHMTRDQVITTLIAGYHDTGPAGASGLAPTTQTAQPAAPDDDASADAAPADAAPTDATPADATPADATPAGAAPAGAAPADATAYPSTTPLAIAPSTVVPGRPAASGDAAPPTPAPDERLGIEIRIGLSTLLGRDEHPAEIPGLGLLIAPDARHRVAQQARAQWRFAVTDDAGHLLTDGITRRRPPGIRRDGPPGGIVELHVPVALLNELAAGGVALSGEWAQVVADIADQYARCDQHHKDVNSRPGARLPGAALRRHTEIRDRSCTFPGCRRSARACAQDHTRDHHRGGATVTGNLGPACARDHTVKHDGGWRVTQPEPGTFVWTSPLGGVYRTAGETFLPPMPEPEREPVDLAPNFDQPTATREGPILYRPPPGPPAPAPPPLPACPDEPPF